MSRRDSMARDIMRTFVADTGLTSAGPPRRYLWTDAHAVCNLIALAARLGEPEYLDIAVALADQVHQVLGRHRVDDVRDGWISGLDEASGQQHPTSGGLRIGKTLPERAVEERYDAHAEWDRDGQYFHYLTKWMHALYQLGRATNDLRYVRWGQELAVTAVEKFTTVNGSPRLAWKMSIDLSRALVPSSGQHDPLDGYITALVLLEAAPDKRLADTVGQLEALCQGREWATDDPLGIGGLLFDACRLAQSSGRAGGGKPDQLFKTVAGVALHSLNNFLSQSQSQSPLRQPASHRLAFRELGMAIGLHGIGYLQDALRLNEETVEYFSSVAQDIEAFWLTPSHQQQPTWLEHHDINSVMLATSLLSASFLEI